MKKYIAIGHFDDSENTTCVAESTTSIKSFRSDCIGNGFRAHLYQLWCYMLTLEAGNNQRG